MARTIYAAGLADNMNDLQIGKMYLIKQYFWLIYPTKELARRARPSSLAVKAAAMLYGGGYETAKWWGKHYNCNVDVVEPNTCFVLLEQDELCFKVLDSNGNIGWIRCYDFSKCFELVKE